MSDRGAAALTGCDPTVAAHLVAPVAAHLVAPVAGSYPRRTAPRAPCVNEVTMDAKTKMLSRVPLFAGLGERALEQVAGLADEVDVAAGTTLTHEGATGGEFFIIIDGGVEITRAGGVLNTLGPGDFLGEIALVDGGPRTATARTTSASRLLVLASREFHTLLADQPEVRLGVLQALAARVRRLDAQAT